MKPGFFALSIYNQFQYLKVGLAIDRMSPVAGYGFEGTMVFLLTFP